MIEDLQWARPETLDTLAELLRASAELPVLCAFSVREDAAMAVHERLDLPAAALATVHVEPFDRAESDELVTAMLGGHRLPVEMLERVAAFADGLPRLIEEAVEALIDGGHVARGESGWSAQQDRNKGALDGSLGEVLQRRIGRLPGGDRELLDAIAISGRRAPRAALIAMLERPVAEAEIDRLKHRGYVIEQRREGFGGDRVFSLRKDGLRTLLLERMPEAERLAKHRKLASWLLDWHGGVPDGMQATLADHLLAAGEPDAALGHLLHAAGESVARMDDVAGYELYGEVLRLVDQSPDGEDKTLTRVEAALGRARVGVRLGEYAEAINAARVAAINAADRPVQSALAHLYAGEAIAAHRGFEEAAIEFERAIAALGDAPDDDGAGVLARARLAGAQLRLGRTDDARTTATEGLRLAAGLRQTEHWHRGKATLHGVLGRLAVADTDLDAAADHFRQARQHGRAAGDTASATMSALSLGNVAFVRGDHVQARAIYEHTARSCADLGHRHGEAVARTNLGHALLELGDVKRAREELQSAHEVMVDIGGDASEIERLLRRVATLGGT